MIEGLSGFYPDWNYDWFILINSVWSSPFLEAVLPSLRHKLFWIPLYLFIISFLIINHQKKGIWAVAFCLLSFGLSNTISAEIMKPYFKIDRPCNDPVFKTHVETRIRCGGGKSFPSAHATNHFALSAYLFFILRRKYKKTFLPLALWAATVSYAQVFVGVHYPVDIMIGGAIGITIGFLVAKFYNLTVRL